MDVAVRLIVEDTLSRQRMQLHSKGNFSNYS
jgi:hypothetical protein